MKKHCSYCFTDKGWWLLSYEESILVAISSKLHNCIYYPYTNKALWWLSYKIEFYYPTNKALWWLSYKIEFYYPTNKALWWLSYKIEFYYPTNKALWWLSYKYRIAVAIVQIQNFIYYLTNNVGATILYVDVRYSLSNIKFLHPTLQK